MSHSPSDDLSYDPSEHASDGFHNIPFRNPPKDRPPSGITTESTSETGLLSQSTGDSSPTALEYGEANTIGNNFNINTPIHVDGATGGSVNAPIVPVTAHQPASVPEPSAPLVSLDGPGDGTSTVPAMTGALVAPAQTGNAAIPRPSTLRNISKLWKELVGSRPKNVAVNATVSAVLDADSPGPASISAPQRFIKGRDSRVRTWFRDIRRVGRRRERGEDN